jgi:UPF0148 protein
MTSRKEEEIMAEYLLKGGKMLEKACKTCGCPLFEVKGKTLCVVCAENAIAATPQPAAATTVPRPAPSPAAEPVSAGYGGEETCACGGHDADNPCTCEAGGLAEELAFTIHSLCLRVQNEKDPNHVLTLMGAIKEGTDALETLCKL